MPPPFSPLQVLAGLVLSLAIGYGGFRAGALSSGGLLGAVCTGTCTFGLGGWGWGALLVAFFASSSLLSRYRQAEKAAAAAEFAKGGRRDLGQALANGGLGSLLAVGSVLFPHPLWAAAFVGAMAAVNADTWATEVGLLFGRQARLITTGRPVPPGTSGGVSLAGILASLAGAAFIGGLAALLQGLQGGPPGAGAFLLGGLAGGVAGSLADSWLGATVQAVYFCPRCRKETERTLHHCGAPTRWVRGRRWLGNDGVNFAASVVGAAVAAALASAA
ncbi:MAG: DUF92 domain-containing protein [Anaerolineae bacterium]|nr:DUF92 domain-containing protein [Anaerolineae bacterium]